ncbi:hypothetical protein DSM44344_03399 [Mycobacterium marinum]|nr:hypothetical protein DSM44344_03399 [Mycobacterium marinum]
MITGTPLLPVLVGRRVVSSVVVSIAVGVVSVSMNAIRVGGWWGSMGR